MERARPNEYLAPLVLGALLVAAGILLLSERVRADGAGRSWPLVLVVVGVAKIGAGPWEGYDEGLWLVGTGSRLLLDAFAPGVIRSAGSLLVVTAGFVALWQALPRHLRSTRERTHVH